MLSDLLDRAIASYRHLCPHLLMGLRMGLAASEALGIALPNIDRRLRVFMETNGCAAIGVAMATYCSSEHETLVIDNRGKVAAVFIDVQTGRALRIAPRRGMAGRLIHYAPEANSSRQIMLLALQRMPSAQLFHMRALYFNAPAPRRLPFPLAV